jgi:protein-tyrosine-phosphatase
MAEAVMHATLSRHPELHPFVGYIDSAGIEPSEKLGQSPHPETMETLDRHGIRYSHVTRVIEVEDFFKFTYMFCMEREHIDQLIEMRDDASHQLRADLRRLAKIALFGNFGYKQVRRPSVRPHRRHGEFWPEEIVDHSYYREEDKIDAFEIAYKQCKQYAHGFVERELEPLAMGGGRW